jgi:hypothetical protein
MFNQYSRLKFTEERYRREFSSRARLESDFRVCSHHLFHIHIEFHLF